MDSGSEWGRGDDGSTLPNGIGTQPVSNASAARLPGPHSQRTGTKHHSETGLTPPTAGDSIATPSACPQFLPVGQPHRGVNNSQGTMAWPSDGSASSPHPPRVASRYALGVVATCLRNSAVK